MGEARNGFKRWVIKSEDGRVSEEWEKEETELRGGR